VPARTALLSGLVCTLLCGLWSSAGAPAGDAATGPRQQGGFIKGADVSFLQEIENRGGVFREAGAPKDPLDILKSHGFNYVRLRLWHDPPAGYCSLDSTLVMASKIKAKGLGLLLDIHYSDTWADPGKQFKPRAWEGVPFEALKDSVYEYTRRVLDRFKAERALPDIVQIGNEITCGMLWDDGRTCGAADTPEQWRKLGGLVRAGVRGAGDALGKGDSLLIMIHTDRGADRQGSARFYDHMLAEGVRFDLIGLSYYPWWHGTLDEVRANLDTLARRYDKDIIVVETAYPWTLGRYDDTHNSVGLPGQLHPGYSASVPGQKAFLADLLGVVARVSEGRGRGVFYWAPEYISVPGLGSTWENVTLFDSSGNALPAMSVFTSR
jgi:arabinogalactan endo-1,4-beta-galactosidase